MTGVKNWAHLEKLEAVDVNSFLMGQAVPRFANSTARDTAIPTPVAGRVCYVTGTGLQVHNGTGWITQGLGTLTGAGSPEGNVEAAPGTLYTRTDGAAGTMLYQKITGTGDTGWMAFAAAGYEAP